MKIVIVDKYGKVKETKLKNYDVDMLYSKAGFKVSTHFGKSHTWTDLIVEGKKYDQISIYGKKQGKAGQENKYELPPPLDTTLFFGSIVVTHLNHDNTTNDITKQEFKDIVEVLMGGYEDLDDDSDDDEEEELPEGVELDKNGYAKDGFVVDDEEEDEEDEDYEDYESEMSEEDYFKN